MRIKRNKFLIFALCNIILLIILLFLAIPASKFLSKINFDDNELVKDQIVINPKAQSPKIIERKMQVKFVAEVDDLLNWDFISLQENISVKIGENNVVKYEGKNLEIGFNIGYLEDVLNSMETEEVELFFYGEDSSCLLKSVGEDSSLYVVMPMRL